MSDHIRDELNGAYRRAIEGYDLLAARQVREDIAEAEGIEPEEVETVGGWPVSSRSARREYDPFDDPDYGNRQRY